MNKLYCGDNLIWLKSLESNSVDLIYLDPPFQSGKNYNLNFEKESEKHEGATVQRRVYTDTWKWGEKAKKEYLELLESDKLHRLLKSMFDYLGECSMMAYLVMMAPRLVEMQRVLKDTGSIYLHCDQHAEHYLRILMDAVFGTKNFRDTIIWKRCNSHKFSTKKFDNYVDFILFYSKDFRFVKFNIQYEKKDVEFLKNYKSIENETNRKYAIYPLRRTLFNETIRKRIGELKERTIQGKTIINEQGWRWSQEKINKEIEKNPNIIHWSRTGVPYYKIYEDQMAGRCVSNLWLDIKPLSLNRGESAGWPGQKPEALLERIIKTSSDEGDLILDPFCGYGSALMVSKKLKRNWIGMDISMIGIQIIYERLKRAGYIAGVDFEMEGFATDPYSEEVLKNSDPKGYEILIEFRSRKKDPNQQTIINEFGDLMDFIEGGKNETKKE